MATWSIKSSGGDFTTLQSANDSGSVNNGDTLSVDEAFVCQSSALTLSKTLTVTASGSFGIAAPTYAECTTKARITGSGSPLVSVSGGGTIDKIGVNLTGTDNAPGISYSNGGTFQNSLVRCAGSGQNYGFRAAGGTVTVRNVGIYGATNVGIYPTSGTLNAIHTVVVGVQTSYGVGCFGLFGGTAVANACIAQAVSGTVSGFSLWSESSADCVSFDASTPGTNALSSRSGFLKDVGSTTWDLGLLGLNGGLLPGVTDYGVTPDIAGNARPLAAGFPIDPGCAQIASGPSVMAYADAGSVVTPGSSTLTISINVPSSNCRMLVFASGRGAGVASCDWNGTALAQIANTAKNDGTMFTEVWDLGNPGTGTHNVSVVFSGSATRIWAAVVVEKYVGATAAAAVDVSGGNAAGHTTTLTTTDNDAGGIDIETEGGDSAPTPTSPSVFLGKTSSGSFNYPRLSAYLPGAAGSKTMAWSGGDVQSVVYVKPGAAGGGGMLNKFAWLGGLGKPISSLTGGLHG